MTFLPRLAFLLLILLYQTNISAKVFLNIAAGFLQVIRKHCIAHAFHAQLSFRLPKEIEINTLFPRAVPPTVQSSPLNYRLCTQLFLSLRHCHLDFQLTTMHVLEFSSYTSLPHYIFLFICEMHLKTNHFDSLFNLPLHMFSYSINKLHQIFVCSYFFFKCLRIFHYIRGTY